MKIDSYAMKTSSQREYLKAESASTRLVQREIVPTPLPAGQDEKEKDASAKLDLSEEAKKLIDNSKENNKRFMNQLERSHASALRGSKLPSNPTDLKLTMLEELIYMLTGKRYSANKIDTGDSRQSQPFSLSAFAGQSMGQRAAMGTFLETESFVYERESVSFQAQGVVKTADGKTINLDLSMNMSREFAAYSKTSVQMESLSVDPLVINYGGTAASLTGERFAFDLDCDGAKDMISSLGEGSGFLALDKNGDGKINDGSELFGPQSGSGFDELRRYDSDGNGWIDENDSVFDELLVWSKDKDGNDQLFKLKELDIGAIYLGEVSTEFSMNGGDNESYGIMRSTSVFLKESGEVGTVSHIDLTL